MLKFILKMEHFGGWLWLLPEQLQNRAEMVHDQWLTYVNICAKNRHKELIEVKKTIRDWKESPEMAEFSKKARMRYLVCQLRSAIEEFKQNREKYIELVRTGHNAKNCVLTAEKLLKRINGYKYSISVLKGEKNANNAITDEMIERAREYPLESILEIGQNRRAKCCFHQGEDFNMDIRKNFAHCYVCGESGDVIKVYMALNGVGFKEAVIRLNNAT